MSRDLEIWVWGHSRSLKMASFDTPYTTFHWSFIVKYSSILYHFRDKARYWWNNFVIPPSIRRPLGGPRWTISIPFGTEKTEWCGYSMVKKFKDPFSHFDRILACDERTDRRLVTT